MEIKRNACEIQVLLVVTNPHANAGDLRDTGSIPAFDRIPWRRARQSTPVFLPGESQGQRSLMGSSPQGCKEAVMTGAALRARVGHRM